MKFNKIFIIIITLSISLYCQEQNISGDSSDADNSDKLPGSVCNADKSFCIKNIAVMEKTTTTFTTAWSLSAPGTAYVKYWTSSESDSKKSAIISSLNDKAKTVTVRNLKSSTQYSFRIVASNGFDEIETSAGRLTTDEASSGNGPVCGNGKCETGETPDNCLADCRGGEIPTGELYDDFNADFDNTKFYYDDSKGGTANVSGGTLVLQSDRNARLYSLKFKIPVIIEGKAALSDTDTSYIHLGVTRIPFSWIPYSTIVYPPYESDCPTYQFFFLTAYSISNLYLERSYYSDESNKTAEEVTTSFNETATFDFRFEISSTSQKIYYNDSLVHEYTSSLSEKYWWTFYMMINYPISNSELEWIRITSDEFGDLSGVY